MLWLNFIHLYQPANSSSARIKEAADKSYWRLTRLLEENPSLFFTANISACLLERLRDEGYEDLLESWRRLIKDGRLELVGSAAYHGFLPFLPTREVLYQIKRQEEIILEILGVDVRGGGFFLPEMAYTPELAKLVRQQGYSWLILDEAVLPKDAKNVNVCVDNNSDLKIIIRHRSTSNAYLPDTLNKLSLADQRPELIITATDAELYGLRHEDPTAELEKMVKIKDLRTQTVSNFLQQQVDFPTLTLRSASWETNQQSRREQPFVIWRDRHNRVQTDLWNLAALALAAGENYPNDPGYQWYRWHLNRGLASCAFWWASGWDFFHNFGPVAWNPDEVENGLNDLVRSLRSLQDQRSLREKIKGEKLAAKIRRHLWELHWQKYWLK